MSMRRAWYHSRHTVQNEAGGAVKLLNRNGLLARGLLVLCVLAGAGCDDLHLTGPEDPDPVLFPGLVDVTVEYRQPNLCFASSNCEDPVVFFGSWLPVNQSVTLQRATAFVWRGVARGVPVNFPPRDDPHVVAIYDPHLRDTELGGVTAGRLRVGGELLTMFVTGIDAAGTPRESAFVYIDENGFGHNPF
jgi:hypothetical protein